jgi:hypothetical protein
LNKDANMLVLNILRSDIFFQKKSKYSVFSLDKEQKTQLFVLIFHSGRNFTLKSGKKLQN